MFGRRAVEIKFRNIRQRLGFRECHRKTGNRQVRGGTYDGLTFLLDAERFYAFWEENP